MTEKFLRLKDVMELLSVSKSTVWQWAKEGKLPQPIKLSPRVTVWKQSEIQEFINSMAAAGNEK